MTYNGFELFTKLLTINNRAIRNIKNKEMRQLNLNAGDVSCLYYLAKHQEGLTATQLCQLCADDKSIVSKTLEQLEKQQYVYCESTEGKRYNSRMFLTDKGKETAVIVIDKINDILRIVNQDINPSDREIFYRCFEKITSRLLEL